MPLTKRHPQVPSITQTGMPKYDPFSEPLLLTVPFQEMTIKYLMYMQKVPFLYTERACVVFFSFEICPGTFCLSKKVLQVFQTRGSM